MLVITFIACSGVYCEHVQQRSYDMTPLYCELKGGQEIAAEWVRRHPGFQVDGRIRCEARG